MTPPRISVVVPVWNRARALEVCLRSLQEQTLPHECIVVDQDSTDGSAEIAASLGARVLRTHALTVGALRNQGVAASSGELIAFLDSDHEVPSDWLESGVRALTASQSTGIAGSRYLPPSPGTWVTWAWGLHRLRDHAAGNVAWLSAGNMFIRRIDFEAVGGFRESLVATEDVDLCYRVRGIGKEIYCDPRIRNVHHGEPATLVSFFQKQRWRGKGGWDSWAESGYPLRELKSLLFPAWVVAGSIAAAAIAAMALLSGDLWSFKGAAYVGAIWTIWLLPPLCLAFRVALSARRPRCLAPLFVLYITYGFARVSSWFSCSPRP